MSKEKPVKKRVLVVAAHPDDEVLGCGGTIASHILNDDDVHIIILSKGITSRNIPIWIPYEGNTNGISNNFDFSLRQHQGNISKL